MGTVLFPAKINFSKLSQSTIWFGERKSFLKNFSDYPPLGRFVTLLGKLAVTLYKKLLYVCWFLQKYLCLKLPGLLLKVACMPVHIACIAIDQASSMKSFALLEKSQGGSPCNSVRKTLPMPIVWCIRSQIASACKFLIEVGAPLILQPRRRNWNSGLKKISSVVMYITFWPRISRPRLGHIFLPRMQTFFHLF